MNNSSRNDDVSVFLDLINRERKKDKKRNISVPDALFNMIYKVDYGQEYEDNKIIYLNLN